MVENARMTRRLVMLALLATAFGCASAAALPSNLPHGTRPGVSLKYVGVFDARRAWVGEEAGMWCASPDRAEAILGITNSIQLDDFQAVGRSWGAFHNAVRVSSDSGRSWSQTLVTNEAQQEFDPACVYGSNDNIFIASLPFQPELNTAHNYSDTSHAFSLWRSSDGGHHWGAPARVNFPGWFDRVQLSVWRNRTGLPDRLYVAGATMSLPPHRTTRPGQVIVFTSDDNGGSFAPGVTIPTGVGVGDGVIHLGNAVVSQSGRYSIGWTEGEIFGVQGMFLKRRNGQRIPLPRKTSIKVATSGDGGRTFAIPVIVAHANWNSERNDVFTTFGKWYPSLAVGAKGNRFVGRLYVAWPDSEQGAQFIRFSYSDDGGAKWSRPITISGHRNHKRSRGPYAGMVSLAVNGEGIIGALFYEQEAGSTDKSVWPKFRYSRNGGSNWSSSIRVASSGLKQNESGIESPARVRVAKRSFDEPGLVPTCNYGLTVDANGDFRLFVLKSVNAGIQTDGFLARIR
jgi:hypothetical protein